MNILLFSMPDSFEHMPTIAIRMPNGALTSLAGNVDPHHRSRCPWHPRLIAAMRG
jgi:anaerobic magnesium-protoporphyrin IX monomethyl ester cyclase